MKFGDIYEQALVKTVAGFSRGNPTHLFGVTRFGASVVYVRAASIHLPYSIRSSRAKLAPDRIGGRRERQEEETVIYVTVAISASLRGI